MITMQDVEKIREQFPITKSKVFLNHAAHSPLPKPVADVIRNLVNEDSNLGNVPIEWEDKGKPHFARLINARTEELAFVESTSVGMNIAASVLHYPPDSKIVTTDLEYPSVVYPFLRKSLGTKVHYVKNDRGKIRLEDIEKAVDDRTVAVALSQVEYSNGFRHDLKPISEIAHDHGAYLIVDGIQAAGAVSVDVKRDDVDFLACACYKWLLGPLGAAYFYVKKELIEKFEPPFVGWASVKQSIFDTIEFWDIWKLDFPETAARFEVGSPSVLSLMGAREALRMLLDVGIESIERRILDLTDYLMESITKLGLELQTPQERAYRSGIVNFRVKNPKEVAEKLDKKGIVVSARANGIRVSPHFYNTEDEIDKLIEEVRQYS